MQSIFFLPTGEDRCNILSFSLSRFIFLSSSFFKLKEGWILTCTVTEQMKIWIHNQFPVSAANRSGASAGSRGIRKECLATHNCYRFPFEKNKQNKTKRNKATAKLSCRHTCRYVLHGPKQEVSIHRLATSCEWQRPSVCLSDMRGLTFTHQLGRPDRELARLTPFVRMIWHFNSHEGKDQQ